MADRPEWLRRGRKALRMSPRQLARRLRDELRERMRRPWSRVYPRLLSDRTILGGSGAKTIDDLWASTLDGSFFVKPADRESFVAEYRRRFPSGDTRIFADANAALRHQFDLLGSGPIVVGERLPWLDDFKTSRRYPLQYCRDIEYMELDQPTDVKVPWELSRCQHFAALGQAYWLMGDERYPGEFVAEVTDWIDQNPWAYSVNWACAMDVALRGISWIWGFFFMGASRSCADPGFRRAFLRSLYLHGEFVFTHLETSDVNGNHYLSDGAGLVFMGLFFRHTRRGRQWLEKGRAIILGELFAQTSEDGVDFEQSTAYHRLVLELFLTSYLLLEHAGVSVPDANWQRLSKMIEFVAAYTKPDGLAPLVGDADDGRVQKLGGQRLNDHRYLVCAGAVRFGRPDLKRAGGAFAEEAFWLLGLAGAAAHDRLQAAEDEPRSVAFPAGGFYVMRNRHAHVFIDCGEVGMAGRGGHGHNDILGFELFLNGVNVITDCGAYLYTASREWRNRFRSTAFHNVVEVDGEELNRFIGDDALWQLRYDAHPAGVRWEPGERDDYFRGGHDGYRRLNRPVHSSREMIVAHDQPLVVLRDTLAGDGEHDLVWRFHFDPALTPELHGTNCRLRRGDDLVWMRLDEASATAARIDSGWVSPSYGVRVATQVLIVERREALPASLLCVFAAAPVTDDHWRQAVARLTRDPGASIQNGTLCVRSS